MTKKLPPLTELLRLSQSERYRLSGEPQAATSGFGSASRPYLWASEFPGPVLAALALRLSPPVVCIAGSGDNPVEFLRLGLSPVIGVDVSRPACYVNELKAAALASGLSRGDYLALLPSPPADLLARLAPGLSPEALAWWRQASATGGPEPASLLDLRPHLPGLAYLATEAAFAQAQRLVHLWPLLNMTLEDSLAGLPEGSLGTVYLSNVAEYVQRELLLAGREAELPARLAALYELVASRLSAGGAALAYVFEGCGRAARGPEARLMAAAGLSVCSHPVEFHRLDTLFHHCLLEARRTRGGLQGGEND